MTLPRTPIAKGSNTGVHADVLVSTTLLRLMGARLFDLAWREERHMHVRHRADPIRGITASYFGHPRCATGRTEAL